MACSMKPACDCHAAVCTVCDCLHDPCGWACTAERWLRMTLRQILGRIRNVLP